MPRDGHHRVVVDGRVDDLRLRVAELGDVRGEVGLALPKLLLRDDLEAELLGLFAELLGQARRVEIVRREEDADLLLAQRLGHEAGARLALRVVGEADAEHERPDLGDVGVGRRRRDHGHVLLVGHDAARLGSRRGHLAEDGHHLVAIDELEDLLVASCGFDLSSSKMTLIGLPLTPPALFTSSTASSMPSLVSTPNCVSAPDRLKNAPTRHSAADAPFALAPAGPALPFVAAVAAEPDRAEPDPGPAPPRSNADAWIISPLL